jgi:hypothetical protein
LWSSNNEEEFGIAAESALLILNADAGKDPSLRREEVGGEAAVKHLKASEH